MPPIVWIIIIVVVILWIRSKGKIVDPPPSPPNPSSISFPSAPPDQNYISYLTTFYRITETLASRSRSESDIIIQVRKIYDSYCSVCFRMDSDSAVPFQGVSFGTGYTYGSEYVSFDTRATGFTTPTAVKNEILLQMSTSRSDMILVPTETSILEHGDYTDTPYVSCRFMAKKI